MTFVSIKTGQFSYFNLQLGKPNWAKKKVLDFGGNIGNILRSPLSTINPELYWCLDVDQEAIALGQKDYPNSHWYLYDRYSFYYNPMGIQNLKIPDLGQKFDFIVAYSVFTNTTISDMKDLVGQLIAFLKPGGKLAFTFIDPYYIQDPEVYWRTNLYWRLSRESHHKKKTTGIIGIDTKASIKKVGTNTKWLVLVNGEDLYIEQEADKPYGSTNQRSYHVFITSQFMKELFPYAHIIPPVNGEMQHCCIIKKTKKLLESKY